MYSTGPINCFVYSLLIILLGELMIELQDIVVKYGDFVAIKDINLKVEKGEFFTLLGPSGCGKTTTLRTIAGFNPIASGQVVLNGEDISNTPVEKRQLGMVFQSYALFPTMTVYDNIAYGLKVDRQSKTEIDQRVRELAALVEINETQLKRNVAELSGGQQQRVAIARALAKKPEVVLFDEPLSNLDAKLRKQLRAELKKIQRDTGMTAIYVTHDQEEALEMSDRIAVFNNGVIEQIGTPDQIYNRSQTEFICNFIGESNPLGPGVIQAINQKATNAFDPSKKHYIRLEKVKLHPNEVHGHWVSLEGQILDQVFQGSFTKYEVICQGETITVIDKNDGTKTHQVGQSLTLYIDPSDILEY